MQVGFTIRDSEGVRNAALPALLKACCAKRLLDLPRLAPHQRAPMTELLAAIISASRLYGGSDAWTVEDWTAALAEVPLDLCPEKGAAGFLQPSVVGVEFVPVPFEYIDAVQSGSQHPIKATMEVDEEAAALALVGGLRAGPGGRRHRGAHARGRLLSVMVSTNGGFVEEVLTLAAAFDEIARAGSRLADHLLWSKPWTKEEHVDDLPRPFIECRALRLLKGERGITATRAETDARLEGTWIDDPHVPQRVPTNERENASPYRTVMVPLTHEVLHATLFGSAKVIRPRLLDRKDPVVVRLSGSVHRQGTAPGADAWYEFIYRTHGGLIRKERCARLSEAALSVVKQAERIVKRAGVVLYDERQPKQGENAARVMPRTMTLRDRLIEKIGPRSVDEVLRLLPLGESQGDEETALQRMAFVGIREVWATSVSGAPLLAMARASNLLDFLCNRELKIDWKDINMADERDNGPTIYAVLADIAGHLTPSQRAQIRASTSLYAAVVGLSRVPARLRATEDQELLWMAAIRALGSLNHGGPSIGAALAASEYPLNRLERLLMSSGESLVAQMEEAVRWLASSGETRVNLTDLIALALCPDHLRARLRLRIAKDYVRIESARAA